LQFERVYVNRATIRLRRRVQLVLLATRHLLPTVYFQRAFVEVGGLVSYAANDLIRYREVGIYTGRILKGEKPADMPVVQPTKFELFVCLPAARAIGIVVPPSLLAVHMSAFDPNKMLFSAPTCRSRRPRK